MALINVSLPGVFRASTSMDLIKSLNDSTVCFTEASTAESTDLFNWIKGKCSTVFLTASTGFCNCWAGVASWPKSDTSTGAAGFGGLNLFFVSSNIFSPLEVISSLEGNLASQLDTFLPKPAK
ncbi:hypothetical protein CANTEDRAFT_124798 [Yamadazyma tenuis ATCC 10573]|uniref:Uncharacterized protein n=1 Tax=Candida tenuis (strain ATCC 10573 / BCRC 21748 / CBS 615 / JCM 9827 / NBRC 10315 / NRRL Y-1498 / VKM Y-70) TaxID=590646 RepID=G3B8C2_CANTC|nr:uncharacterized protein CANTEDRAFT_124798 [Yamadazyma tenuis ATCC 10573]EGV62955.1 hypothetical protein CANTEDRAFT_124798 [Yamadazyma tenuis ATCC 10573]